MANTVIHFGNKHMLRRIVSLLFLLACGASIVGAQNTFTEEFIFVDGTVIRYPSQFLIYDQSYDRMFMADDQTDIYIYVLYPTTIQRHNLDTLAKAMNFYFDNETVYQPGDEEPISIGGREGVQFRYTVEQDLSYDRWYVALPVQNGESIAIMRVQPNIDQDITQDPDTELALAILENAHFVDFRANLQTVLGNSMPVDEDWMIEYGDNWRANTDNQTLQRDETEIVVDVYSPAEIEALDLKNDPIELLYYDVYAPSDSTIAFDPTTINFERIGAHDGVRYQYFDTVDGEAVQRAYFLAPLGEGSVLALLMVSPVGSLILQDSEVRDMIQTVRPSGTLPPLSMMELNNGYILNDLIEIRFPDYWHLRENDNNTITLATLDTNLYIAPFNANYVAEQGYSGDLATALVKITTPQDDSVILNPDDVLIGTLENGHAYAELQYMETYDERTYPRIVWLIALEDESLIFIGVIPQPGVEAIAATALAESLAIANTIVLK